MTTYWLPDGERAFVVASAMKPDFRDPSQVQAKAHVRLGASCHDVCFKRVIFETSISNFSLSMASTLACFDVSNDSIGIASPDYPSSWFSCSMVSGLNLKSPDAACLLPTYR